LGRLMQEAESSHSLSDAQRAVLRARAEARAQQTRIDAGRMEKHQRMVSLMADRDQREALLAAAEAHVSRWERNGLCWSGYVSAWRNLLAMPVDQMSRIILAADGDGPALRQNSPFLELLPPA